MHHLYVRVAIYFMTERLDSITPDLCLVVLWRVVKPRIFTVSVG